MSARAVVSGERLAFHDLFRFEPPPPKPRSEGLNMCLDDGMGIAATRDLFEVVGEYVDSIRLGRGTAALFPRSWVLEKAALCREFDVDMMTGGPLYEVAVARDAVREFLEESRDLGFTSIEFSENIISIPVEETLSHVKVATDLGLDVYFEYGRKYPGTSPLDVDEAEDRIGTLLEAGVTRITVERAEVDLVVHDHPHVLVELAERVGLGNLIFEAGPRKIEYCELLMSLLGPAKVNLGNIALQPPNALDGILILVNARRGLDRSVDYQFVRDVWGGPVNDGDPAAHG
ncbi:MAG TPA: phosphosulfolactate synthase [Actinomycetota bacterium]|nr:phosphosulfolactate synthase [Actinomycetota bacterium]